jgi:hypothetical protein
MSGGLNDANAKNNAEKNNLARKANTGHRSGSGLFIFNSPMYSKVQIIPL